MRSPDDSPTHPLTKWQLPRRETDPSRWKGPLQVTSEEPTPRDPAPHTGRPSRTVSQPRLLTSPAPLPFMSMVQVQGQAQGSRGFQWPKKGSSFPHPALAHLSLQLAEELGLKCNRARVLVDPVLSFYKRGN